MTGPTQSGEQADVAPEPSGADGSPDRAPVDADTPPKQLDTDTQYLAHQEATKLAEGQQVSKVLSEKAKPLYDFFADLGFEFPVEYQSYLELAVESGISFNYLSDSAEILVLKDGDQIMDDSGNPIKFSVDLTKTDKTGLAMDIIKAIKPVLNKYAPEKLPESQYTELLEAVKEAAGPNPGPISKALIAILVAMIKYGPVFDFLSANKLAEQAAQKSSKLEVEDLLRNVKAEGIDENLYLSIDARLSASGASANFSARALLDKDSSINSINALVEKLTAPLGEAPDTFQMYTQVDLKENLKDKLVPGSLILFEENGIKFSGILKENNTVYYYDKTQTSVVKKPLDGIPVEKITQAYRFNKDQAEGFLAHTPAPAEDSVPEGEETGGGRPAGDRTDGGEVAGTQTVKVEAESPASKEKTKDEMIADKQEEITDAKNSVKIKEAGLESAKLANESSPSKDTGEAKASAEIELETAKNELSRLEGELVTLNTESELM